MSGRARPFAGSVVGFAMLGSVLALPIGAAATVSPPAKVPASATPATCVWSIVPHVPPVDVGDNDLRAVAALPTGDAWAVGFSMSVSGLPHTLVLHGDGASWHPVETPSRYRYSRFFAVAAVAPDDVWAAGDFFAETKGGALAEHWDGHRWRIYPTGSSGQILGLAALARDDVWAVGETAKGDRDVPFARHWDGTGWRKVKVPFGIPHGWLDAVGATSPSDVWAGGQPNLTYRWDGGAWQEVVGPGGQGITFIDAIAAVAADDVWAIGNDGRGGFSRHWDGATWTVARMPRLANTQLTGAVAMGSADVWAVGSNGHRGPFTAHTLAMHWDGTRWSKIATPNPDTPRTRAILRGIAADPSGLWSVGQFLSHGRWRPLIERCA